MCASRDEWVQDVTAGLVHRYWPEDGLLYAKSGKLFVPSRKIRRELFVRTYVNHVRNICHLELANYLKQHTLLVIG